ncbi:MAG: hydroxyphenylacetyl-CoA thioesterase PaaI [Aquificota bacterium]|nr:MAG: hydroxyphenylacetyl-CoA thioesterase PaaI [Aquificota bacterium]
MKGPEGIAQKVKNYIGKHDRLVGLLGARIEEVTPGYARVTLTVDDKHLNAANVCHGGVLFTLADLAFALASNSHGQTALALEVSFSFLKAAVEGDQVVAQAREVHLGRRTATYLIEVTRQGGEKVALMKGTVFRFDRPFPPEE